MKAIRLVPSTSQETELDKAPPHSGGVDDASTQANFQVDTILGQSILDASLDREKAGNLAEASSISASASDEDSEVESSIHPVEGRLSDSSLKVDFYASSPRLREQGGQFRLSNPTTSALGHRRHFLTEIGPGLFPCESHSISISLRDRSKVMIESQSATKVHVATENTHAVIEYRFSVAGSSSLIALQAPTISYAGSKLISSIYLDVEHGSRAIVSEMIAKVATTDPSIGCTWVDMMIEINYGGELMLVDRVATVHNPIYNEVESKTVIAGGKGVVGGIYIVGYHEVSIDALRRFTSEIAMQHPSVEVSSPTSPTPEVSLLRARGDDPYAIETFFGELAKAISGQINLIDP